EKDLGPMTQERRGVLSDEGFHLVDLLGATENVDLVHDQHDLLAPGADLLEKLTLAFSEGPIGRGHEKDEIGAGNEVSGELFMTPNDGVGPRRIDDVQLPQ